MELDNFVVSSCPLCGDTRLERIAECTDRFDRQRVYPIEECAHCGLRFTQDAPFDVSATRGHKVVMRGQLLRHCVKLLRQQSMRKYGRLLDIGSGEGHFAHAMKEEGWAVETVEASESARLAAWERYGIRTKEVREVFNYQPSTFEAITLWHVMEEVDDLDLLWSHLYELLTEDGILMVATPNCKAYDAQYYRHHWAGYDVPRTLWHFTPSTMQRMAQHHRFSLVHHSPMPYGAFHIAVESERLRGSWFPHLRGLYRGGLSWLQSHAKTGNSSAVIYIFMKRM